MLFAIATGSGARRALRNSCRAGAQNEVPEN
jgi:hypothetical protein